MLSGVEIQNAIGRWGWLRELKKVEGLDSVPVVLGGMNADGGDDWMFQPVIGIEPFNGLQLNPNSYNLRLHKHLKVYDLGANNPVIMQAIKDPYRGETSRWHLDARKETPTVDLEIPEKGLVLQPGVLYLGRSSTGRLGLSVHETAGFGDVGFCGTWTLEIVVTHPVRVYAGMEVCQICYHEVSPLHENYKGRYLGQVDPTASRLHNGEESDNAV
jgi:dCTP deaminase